MKSKCTCVHTTRYSKARAQHHARGSHEVIDTKLLQSKHHIREVRPGSHAPARHRACAPTNTRARARYRKISGYVCSNSSLWNAFSVYSRKHLPGRVRPARPARCFADACERDAVCGRARAEPNRWARAPPWRWERRGGTRHECAGCTPAHASARTQLPRVRHRKHPSTHSDTPLTFCFENPGSTTYTMPSIVSDVSAMFVDTTTCDGGQ